MPPRRAIAALVTLWVAYAIWLLGSRAGAPHATLNDLFFLPFPWIAAASAWGASRRPTLSGDARQAWRWIAVGLAINATTAIQWLVADLRGPMVALPGLLSLAEIAFYPIALYGCSRFPVARRMRAEARRGWLNGVLVTTALVTLSWYAAWKYTGLFSRATEINTLVNLVIIGSDGFMVWAVAQLARNEHDAGTRPALVALAVAFAGVAVADGWLSLDQVRGSYRSGNPVDAALTLGYALLAVAPLLHRADAVEPLPSERPWTGRPGLLPITCIALTCLPIIVEAVRTEILEWSILVVAMLIVMAVELGRQSDMRRQNRLLAEARVAQDARFRSLVQYSTDMVFVCARDGTVQYASPSVARQLSLDNALVGRSMLEIVHPADRARVAAALAETGAVLALGAPLACRLGDGRAGDWREIECVVTDLTGDPSVVGLVLNARDVSERARLEEQLRQAQKMDAIGRLAGGIAHDFNNILAAVSANAQLLRGMHPGTTEVHEIEQASQRGAALTRQLLEFSRSDDSPVATQRLHEVVLGMEPMLRRLIAAEIAITVESTDSEALVQIDRGHLEQVLLNLAVNARDAMPDGGRLAIRVRAAPATAGDATTVDGVPVTTWAVLDVADSGVGMDDATRRRAFEPFFTTKPRGRGTGLGLSTVYGIVTKAHGRVAIESSPGEGTVVRTLLPDVRAAAPATRPAPARPAAADRTAVVLVVDDEPAIRTSVSRYLRFKGYDTIEAGNGEEALEQLEAKQWAIDLLLTDMVMPRMSGRELVRRVRARAATVPVLCMSGHLDAPDEEAHEPWGRAHVVAKPFELEELARRVALALAAPDAA